MIGYQISSADYITRNGVPCAWVLDIEEYTAKDGDSFNTYVENARSCRKIEWMFQQLSWVSNTCLSVDNTIIVYVTDDYIPVGQAKIENAWRSMKYVLENELAITAASP